MEPYEVVAFNTATASANKIHDDAVASSLGFRGGLVPGVDVYAYLCHPPAAAWGLPWLERGTMQARFHQPVYDGGRVTVTASGDGLVDGHLDLHLDLHDAAGVRCAEATAGREGPGGRPDPADWPDVAQAADPPPAAPEVLAPGTPLGLAPHGFHADRHVDYLRDVREDLALYREEGVAHPGWLLRDANHVLSANVRLGPWIHVGSTVQHLGLVRDGAEVAARGRVVDEWERKGHRFVRLDVLHLADGEPVARTDHTAIYRPRGT